MNILFDGFLRWSLIWHLKSIRKAFDLAACEFTREPFEAAFHLDQDFFIRFNGSDEKSCSNICEYLFLADAVNGTIFDLKMFSLIYLHRIVNDKMINSIEINPNDLFVSVNKRIKKRKAIKFRSKFNIHEAIALKSLRNRIESIDFNFSTYFKYCQVINFSGCRLRSIGKQTFSDLRFLLILLIDRNQITDIDMESFHGLINLEILDISFNQLRVIKKDWFRDLFSLKELYLNSNCIKHIEPNSFKSLKCLNEIFIWYLLLFFLFSKKINSFILVFFLSLK